MFKLPAVGIFLVLERGTKRATLHEYVRSEVAYGGSSVKQHQVRGVAHVYRCTETGAERRYGFDDECRSKPTVH